MHEPPTLAVGLLCTVILISTLTGIDAACEKLRPCQSKLKEEDIIDDPSIYFKDALEAYSDDIVSSSEFKQILNAIIKDHTCYSYKCMWNAITELD